jgi:hypothetical protein
MSSLASDPAWSKTGLGKRRLATCDAEFAHTRPSSIGLAHRAPACARVGRFRLVVPGC